MTTKASVALFLAALGALLSTPSLAISPGATASGSYRMWGGRIDEVIVNRPFKADTYRDILVEPLKSVDVQVPEKPREKEAAEALKSAKAAFMEGLRGSLRERVESSAKGGAVEDALVIRAHLVAIDPGSENARYYLFGLGNGAVKVSIAGEIFERSSHRVLVTFKQTRRTTVGAGGDTGFGNLFAKVTRQLGGDVAALINAF